MDVTRGTIIVAAHGISPDIREILVKRNLKIVDATCSIVKRSQQLVQNLKNENYNIVIIGEEKHPEVKALLGYAGKNAITVNTEEEVERLPKLKK